MKDLSLSRHAQIGVFAVLAVVMAATRFHHFLPVPDASWALFFTGGFLLAGASRWAFPLLMVLAVAIDWVAIQYAGVSNYCVTAAYWFLVPTHAALWFGGLWLRHSLVNQPSDVARLVLSAALSTAAAFTISNSSFYWLGGRYADPNSAEFVARYTQWFPHFFTVTTSYIAAFAVIVMAVRLLLPRLQIAQKA